MKRVGAHVSASGGVSNAVANAVSIGATAFALFVKNQKQWFTNPFSIEEEQKFKKDLLDGKLSTEYVLPHGSYLINLGSPNPEGRDLSIRSLAFEMSLCARLGIKQINVHPGSHLGQISEEQSLDYVAESIDILSERVPEIKIVIENTAGQGSNIGYTIEHLARIREQVKNKKRLGFCLDTCHSFAAGYDLTTKYGTQSFFDKFIDKVGAEFLAALHLNDSKTDLGAKKDRHESLGKGKIGLEAFSYIMNEDLFNNKPLILETVDPNIWAEEIALLHSFVK